MRIITLLTPLLGAMLLLGQDSMTNDGVIKLVKSGMSEELIVNIIRQQNGVYSLGATELVQLKEAGVSEKLIAEMLEKGKAAPATAAGTADAGTKRASINSPGLYYKKNGEYFELIQEEVEWKTSGAMRNIASAGIVKKDLNGKISGISSRNFLQNPMEIVLVPPSGMTVNSYVLLPMKVGKSEREFNVGPVNKKSGLAKGAIAFGVEKLAEGQFRMVLPTHLSAGEYGILAVAPSESASTAGKLYTFRILL
ncbi:MAG TPA: hypothetical protein VFQ91_17115 [Bryobacteraceae bacterium]|nr:hypothetical protein [Bryobacteraceae bacterium]